MDDEILIGCIVSLGIAAGLACIPANIAKKKGYSYGLWWFYGWMLFIVAIIHAAVIPDKNAQQSSTRSEAYSPSLSSQSVADELKKYKELKDEGVISEEEFQLKKEQLLKLM